MSPFRHARFVSVLGLGLYAGMACAGESGDPTVAAGRALYDENCASCHGEAALGDGPLAASLPVAPPSLLLHLGHHTEAQLIQLIRQGVPPAMPPAPLDEDQVRQVVAYVWTLVPESEVAALRAMQEHMEMMGGSAMPGMQGMDHGSGMPGMSTATPPTDSEGGASSDSSDAPGPSHP